MDKHKILFDRYIDLQSKERELNITRYKEFKGPGRLIAINVNLKNGGWLIVYNNKRNVTLWY